VTRVIEIRAYYGDWEKTDREHAKSFVYLMINGFTAIRKMEDKIKRINEKHLRGITFEKLTEERNV